jgi:hypothetical protein
VPAFTLRGAAQSAYSHTPRTACRLVSRTGCLSAPIRESEDWQVRLRAGVRERVGARHL